MTKFEHPLNELSATINNNGLYGMMYEVTMIGEVPAMDVNDMFNSMTSNNKPHAYFAEFMQDFVDFVKFITEKVQWGITSEDFHGTEVLRNKNVDGDPEIIIGGTGDDFYSAIIPPEDYLDGVIIPAPALRMNLSIPLPVQQRFYINDPEWFRDIMYEFKLTR